MTTTTDMAAVVRLACLTEDRDRREQKALLTVAKRIDRDINKQTTPNPHMPPNASLGSLDAPPCTYSADHGKRCACRGDRVAVEPTAGWSRLLDLVAASWTHRDGSPLADDVDRYLGVTA